MDNKEELYRNSKEPGQIEIYTLGRFLVRRGDQVLSERAVRSEKLWLLFKYLLTNRKVAILPETILETLWPRQQYKDPNLAVRSLVHRLRHLFNNELAALDLAANIVFAHGCYRWAENIPYRLDIDEFERLAVSAEPLCEENNHSSAIEALQKATRLYLGDYLPECSCQEWLIPARNYYHHLYIKSVIQLAELLKKAGRFTEIIGLCRNALAIDYFEEKLHLCYLEALLEEGKKLQARSHYEEATAAFYREMGAKQSAAMRRLYGRIGFDHEESFNLNLSLIQERLKDRENAMGAFICDPELFQYFYQLEKKRLERSGQSVCLGLLALTCPDFSSPPRSKLQEAMDYLARVLGGNLRKGDIICRTHEAQFLIILPNLDEAQSLRVLSRIEDKFRQGYAASGLVLHKKSQSLTSDSSRVLIKSADQSYT